MTADPSPWDEDYRRRGSLWGGAPAPLPEIPADARVLELGCGNGKTLAALARRSLHVIAVEISREALLLARRHPATAAAGFVLADARHLPFRDGVFDMVFLVHLAGHLPARDRLTLASEVRRVLAALPEIRPDAPLPWQPDTLELIASKDGQYLTQTGFRFHTTSMQSP